MDDDLSSEQSSKNVASSLPTFCSDEPDRINWARPDRAERSHEYSLMSHQPTAQAGGLTNQIPLEAGPDRVWPMTSRFQKQHVDVYLID